MSFVAYDPKTGKALNYASADAAQADIAAGRVAVRNDQDIRIRGEGGPQWVKGNQLADAIASGARMETEKEQRTQDYVESNAVDGAMKVGVGKAASELAFGVPELLYNHLADKEDVENWEALKEAHAVASGVGSALGIAGNIAATGGLGLMGVVGKAGKAAELATLGGEAATSLGGKVLGSAVRFGTEGALLSAPQVVTEASLGDFKEAGEHLAFGLGGGAALGAVGGAVSPMLKGLGKLASEGVEKLGLDGGLSGGLKNLSEKQAFRSLMYGTDKRAFQEADRLAGGEKELGRYLLDNNLLRTPGESFEQYVERVGQHKDAVGQQIGGLYKQLDAAGARASTPTDLAVKFTQDVIDPLRTKATRGAEVKRLEGFVDEFLQAADKQAAARGLTSDAPMAVGDLWETAKDLGRKIYQEKKSAAIGNLTPIDQELDKFRRLLTDDIKTAAEPALKDLGRDAASELSSLNAQFRKASMAEKIAERSAASELTRRHLSLTDYITGGAAGHAMAGAHGGPVGMVGGMVTSHVHKFLRENGNTLVAKYADKLGTFFAHQAVEEGEKRIAEIPRILQLVAKGEPVAAEAPANVFHVFLGDKAAKNDDDANFKDVSQRITQAAADPSKQLAHVNATANVLANGAPQVAKAYVSAEKARFQYLYQQLPKPPPPAPFQPNTGWKPNRQQVKEFKDKLEVALNPYAAIDHVKRGTLTGAHVDALKNTSPSVYQRIVTETSAWGMTPAAAKMPYSKKMHLSLLLGTPLDATMRDVAIYQQNFATEAKAQQQAAQAPAGKLSNVPGAELTSTQRVRYG